MLQSFTREVASKPRWCGVTTVIASVVLRVGRSAEDTGPTPALSYFLDRYPYSQAFHTTRCSLRCLRLPCDYIVPSSLGWCDATEVGYQLSPLVPVQWESNSRLPSRSLDNICISTSRLATTGLCGTLHLRYFSSPVMDMDEVALVSKSRVSLG